MNLVQCAHSPNTKAKCVTELLCTLPFRRYDSLCMKLYWLISDLIPKKSEKNSKISEEFSKNVLLKLFRITNELKKSIFILEFFEFFFYSKHPSR